MSIFFKKGSKGDIGKLIHVGAGNGIELKDYTTQSFTEILLLEPNPKVFKSLENKIERLNDVNCKFTLCNTALAKDTKEQSFYITKPSRYSGLYKAEKLKELFQNLRIEQQTTVQPINFSDLIQKTNLDKKQKNALILQINGAEFGVITQAETSELMLFSSIVIQHAKNNYFEQTKLQTDLVALMEEKGFELAIEADNDAVFNNLIFRKDEKSLKLATLTEQNGVKTTRITELENQLKASNEAKVKEATEATAKANISAEQNKSKTNRITELENQLKEQNKVKDARIGQLKQELGIESEQNKVKDGRIGQLKQQLELKSEHEETSNKLELLMAQIQQQNQTIKNNHNNLVSKLSYGFNNSVKQVESFIGVQSYLDTGQLAMEYHGWPISSDVALFLLGKVEKNNYDLIIEFGSGTSTQLFAKAINNHVKARASHIDDDLAFIGHDKSNSSERSTLPIELPNRIVTFEHNKKYHNKTMAELETNKLSHLVDLVHAPLIEMKIENEDYLYYSCENKLSQLAAIYAERTVKILALIDGPPGATGPLARLPAVPLLLNYLGKHQLDIVLDDYKREEEKETVVRWKKQFEKRYLDYAEESVQCEKGVFFCRINP
jgi:FkbM family methyltransferase